MEWEYLYTELLNRKAQHRNTQKVKLLRDYVLLACRAHSFAEALSPRLRALLLTCACLCCLSFDFRSVGMPASQGVNRERLEVSATPPLGHRLAASHYL